MTVQLPLGIGLRDDATFDTFHPGPNADAVATLESVVAGDGEWFVYLWGREGTGRSHLLQAACARAGRTGRRAGFLPLEKVRDFGAGLVEGWESLDLVCIDDLHRVAGDRSWEEALFVLYNAVRERNGRLVVTSDGPPAGLETSLPDLRSRMGAGLVFQLQLMDEPDALAALQLRARSRGLELSGEVGRYLLRRCRRDMASLHGLLDELDRASLAAQRRLTVPFVRSILRERENSPSTASATDPQ